MPSQWHGSASIVAQNCVAYLFPDVLMTGVFVKPKYLVFMRNVMKYLGICRCHCRTAECSYCEGPSGG